ncbi:methyl jasmonate esterase 1-like [Mercurialis annua]|uniref:methyl jasmonate esterase 1-like n=1 Tax=Mercurialis annua TaxID=3986 RepID=UPI00215DE6D1|nr:methyl jasmonate esterase 1-like [Mercurialis annua]
MEDQRQTHFVLVHGAGHGAWCWYKVASLLKSADYKVTALDMAASGVNPKQVSDLRSFSDYYEPLIEFMASVSSEEKVILVGHSLGGFSISAAMEKFPEKVSVGVFVAAVMPGPDLGSVTLREEFDKQVDSYMDTQIIFDNGPNNAPTAFLYGPEFLATKLYDLSPAEEVTLATLLSRPMPFYTPSDQHIVITEEKFGSVPRVYVVCDKDNILKENFQRWMIEQNPPNDVELIAGSDHMVNVCMPQEFCKCLQKIANKYF